MGDVGMYLGILYSLFISVLMTVSYIRILRFIYFGKKRDDYATSLNTVGLLIICLILYLLLLSSVFIICQDPCLVTLGNLTIDFFKNLIKF